MKRLLVHVEGESEENFVNNLLAPKLYSVDFSNISARLIGNARLHKNRGGITSWKIAQKEIINHLKGDRNCIVTTMIDYYGLPNDWPMRKESTELAFSNKASTIEQALLEDVSQSMGDDFDKSRFIPYIMMHEFEALLFSNCQKFAEGIYKPELASKFQEIRNKFATPEEIDDSPECAPSKRIKSIIPSYQKLSMGGLAIDEIGLLEMCNNCSHFNNWINCLKKYSL